MLTPPRFSAPEVPTQPCGLVSPRHWHAEDNQLHLSHPEVKQCLPQDGTPHPGWAGHEQPRVHCNSAHLCSHPTFTQCTHSRKQQQAQQGHGQHHLFSSAEHTHVHTEDRDAPALLCLPGRAHTLKHLCKYTGMHTHTHLCETTPMCKSNLGTCVSPVLLLHPALSMQILLVPTCATEIPSPVPKVPRAVPLAMQGFGEQHHPEQTAIPRCASSHASLEQPLVQALALTCSGCLMPAALPVMRRSSPLGANPTGELLPR